MDCKRMFLRENFHRIIYCIGMLFVCFTLLCPFLAYGETGHSNKKVLFISSYAYDYVSVPMQIEGIKEALGEDFEIHYLFMNAQITNTRNAQKQLHDKLTVYQQLNRNYDLVILGDDDALSFARMYRQEFFAGVPLVYEGVNLRKNAIAAHEEGMTGIIETTHFHGTIEEGQRMMPAATRVVGIVDDTITGTGSIVQFMDEKDKFPDLEFSCLNTSDYSKEELAEKLASYDEDTILLLLVFTNDKDGNHYGSGQNAAFIAKHVTIPFFTVSVMGLGEGACGGKMVDIRDMGYKAGQMAKSILVDGIDPAQIEPLVMDGTYIFDNNILAKYAITSRQLPRDAVIINKPDNFFTRNRAELITIAVIFFVLLIWLVREIHNNTKRKKMLASVVAHRAMMQVAIKQTGLNVWEYFPRQHLVKLQRELMPETMQDEFIENYPNSWIDSGHVHPDSQAELLEMVRKIDDGANDISGDLRIRYHINDDWSWKRIRYISVYNEQGERTEVIGTAEAIDEYKALEERFLISTKQAGIIAWVYDIPHQRILQEHGRDLFGKNAPVVDFPASAIAGKFVHKDDEARFMKLYERLENGERTANETFRWCIDKDTYRWIRVVYTNIFDASDKPVRAFGTGRDVTEQKRGEERILAEVRRTASQEGETLASSYFDLETGEIYDWNYERTVYAQPDMRLSEGIDDAANHIPDAAERKYYAEHLQYDYLRNQYEQGNYHFTMEYKRKTVAGKLVWVRTYVNLSRHYATGHLAAYVYTRNIDQIKNQQLALNSVIQEEIEYIAVITLKTHQEHILKTRPGCDLQEGYSYSYELQAGLVEQHVVNADKKLIHTHFDLNHILATLEQNEQAIVIYREPDDTGSIRRKRTTIYYLDERKDKLIYVRSDITDLYKEEQRQKAQLEAALREAEHASRVKNDFLSRMSHEIRTPMNAIIGLAALIAERFRDAAYVSKNIEKIDESARFLLNLINDILDISRFENGRMELHENDVLFADFIHSVNALVKNDAAEKYISYQVHSSENLGVAYHFDDLKLKKVLFNILSNAIKFTPTGGDVVFTIERVKESAASDTIRFTVADTGIGIDKDFLPKVFDAFAQEYDSNTTAYGGTGLGLAISQNIVKLMGSEIWVSSVKGKGTTFFTDIELKRCSMETLAAMESVAKVPEQSITTDFSGKRILLAEDNDINREIAQTILQVKGILVEPATNGVEAVQAYLGHDSGYYDAILMDIRMPIMDGLEATRKIRASGKTDAMIIPVLAMTANAFEDDVKKSLDAGMNAHLLKPIDPERLFKKLGEFLS